MEIRARGKWESLPVVPQANEKKKEYIHGEAVEMVKLFIKKIKNSAVFIPQSLKFF